MIFLLKKLILILVDKIYIKNIISQTKMNYIINDDTIIFNIEFDEELDTELISGYKKLIFSDYVLNERIFEHYANNDFNGLEYVGSIFNQDI